MGRFRGSALGPVTRCDIAGTVQCVIHPDHVSTRSNGPLHQARFTYKRHIVRRARPSRPSGRTLGTFGPNAMSALSTWTVVTCANRIDHEVGVLDEPDDIASGRDEAHHASQLADVVDAALGLRAQRNDVA